jgi:hypothetical protein
MTENQIAAQALATLWVKTALTQAQDEFIKNPSSSNWNKVQRAMLTFQQFEHTVRTKRNVVELLQQLEQAPIVDWQDLICLHALDLCTRRCTSTRAVDGHLTCH